MPETQPLFKKKQSEFAAYIRDPENNPLPGDVKKQRMDMYRELFFNNINSFLISNFPVLHRILDEKQWTALAQDFFSKHSCKTPYFTEIPEEFIRYLQTDRKSIDNEPPFMLELAHYEWVEMALMIAKETFPVIDQSLIERPLDYKIALSPLAWPLVYQYPVHKISPAYQPDNLPEQPIYLVVYRDPGFEVRFLAITSTIFRLLQIIQEQEGILATDCIKQIIQESGQTDPKAISSGGVKALRTLAEKGIICKA